MMPSKSILDAGEQACRGQCRTRLGLSGRDVVAASLACRDVNNSGGGPGASWPIRLLEFGKGLRLNLGAQRLPCELRTVLDRLLNLLRLLLLLGAIGVSKAFFRASVHCCSSAVWPAAPSPSGRDVHLEDRDGAGVSAPTQIEIGRGAWRRAMMGIRIHWITRQSPKLGRVGLSRPTTQIDRGRLSDERSCDQSDDGEGIVSVTWSTKEEEGCDCLENDVRAELEMVRSRPTARGGAGLSALRPPAWRDLPVNFICMSILYFSKHLPAE